CFPDGPTRIKFGAGFTDNISWVVPILPYLEQGMLYQKFCAAASGWGTSSEDPNVNPIAAVIPTLLCPSDDNQQHQVIWLGTAFGTCAYHANGGSGNIFNDHNGIAGGAYYRNPPVRITDITDGTSSTFLLGEMSTHHDPLWAATMAANGLATTDWPADPINPNYTAWYGLYAYLVGSSNIN